MKRTPLKKGNKPLVRDSNLQRRKKAGQKRDELHEFFIDIWNSTSSDNKKCESCGKKLNTPARSYYFDHLIEKSKRPDLAFEKDNIFLCCLTCHSLKTDGHPTDPHREAIEKAKEKFGIS